MLRVTADTNVLISAAIVKGNQYEILKLAKLGKIKLITSLPILREFKDVISRPRFGFSEEQIDDVLKQLMDICEVVMPKERLDVVKEDPDDNMVLECAVAGGCEYIVSGDRHLLDMEKFRNISIVNARRFLGIVSYG